MSSKRDKMRDRARARRRVRARRKAVSATKALGPRVLAALETEPLIAYGARCSWWDAKENAGTRESGYKGVPGLPCCPHCGGVLFEIEERTWNLGVETREAFKWAAERDDYPELVAWSRGRCFPDPDAMLAGWVAELEQRAAVLEYPLHAPSTALANYRAGRELYDTNGDLW